MACQSPLALIRIITTGDRGNTPAKPDPAGVEQRRRGLVCRSVEAGPTLAPYYGMGWEHYTILICHRFKKPLAQAWDDLRTWN